MNIPPELLYHIVEFLDRPTLDSFSQVSRQCFKICAPRRYQAVSIPTEGHEEYISHLQAYTKYIRKLQVVDFRDWHSAQLLSCDMPVLYHALRHPVAPDSAIALLTEFIARLPALIEVYWTNNLMFPKPILAQLETTNCRLHLRLFYGKIRRPDSYYVLASSCLHSVHVDGSESLHVVLPALAKSSQIKALHLGRSWVHFPDSTYQQPGRPRGQLTELSMCRSECRGLFTWIDSTSLQTLSMLRLTTEDTAWLCRFEQSGSCPNLRRLKILKSDEPRLIPQLVMGLEHLTHLELGDVNSRYIGTIVDEIGPLLQRLVCSKAFVDQLWLDEHIGNLPQLQHLGIGVQRQQGSHETIYGSIGQLLFLQSVELNIASKQHADTAWRPSPKTEEAIKARACNMLRDLAVDETLVRSIFDAIANAKPSPRLNLLVVKTFRPDLYDGSGEFTDLTKLAYCVAQSFMCEANVEPGSTQRCIVTPVTQKTAEALMAITESDVQAIAEWSLRSVVRELWPACEHKPFVESWHSFPIDQDGQSS